MTEIRKKCDKVLEEWAQVGGLINCYGDEIFIEDEEVYKDWLKAEQLEDTKENQKLYCKIALEYCNVYSDEEIEKILNDYE